MANFTTGVNSSQNLFDEICMDELCTIFNNHPQLPQLANAFKCESKLPEWKTTSNPARLLLQFIASQKYELHHIVNVFLELDVRNALGCLDDLIARKMEHS